MLTLSNRIQAFAKLGDYLSKQLASIENKIACDLQEIARVAEIENPWFSVENTFDAVRGILYFLNEEKLISWTNDIPENLSPKRIGVIMAGNIPLVGFHDALSVLISGHTLKAKTSSKDSKLIKWIFNILCEIEPDFNTQIIISEERLKDFDAIIATGSNNSSRYFEYYFSKYPNIIRHNRNSIAILDGNESKDELEALSDDIFSFFGLGCRNVSKIYFPKGYDPTKVFEGFGKHSKIVNHNKYANNYHYNRTIYLMNNQPHLDNGFVILRENDSFYSPVAVLNYEFYDSVNEFNNYLLSSENLLQCVATNIKNSFDNLKGKIPLGRCQQPELNDYADNVNTLEFLYNL